MKTATLTDDPYILADEEAVLRSLADGTPIPEVVVCRVRERSLPIIEGIRRTHGIIDDEAFQSLLSDDDDP